MKTFDLTKTENTFILPVTDFLTIAGFISKEESRYYLKGVFCEIEPATRTVQMIATDGHIMGKLECAFGSHIGLGVCTQDANGLHGFILDLAATEKALKAKSTTPLWIHGDKSTGILQIFNSDPLEDVAERVGVCEFSIIDGSFPEWRRVVPAETREVSPEGVCLDFVLLDRVRRAAANMAEMDRKTTALRIRSGGAGDPVRVTSTKRPDFLAVVMPTRDN